MRWALAKNATIDIVGEAMLGLFEVGSKTLLVLLFQVLPSGNNLQFPYSEGGKGSRHTKDYHHLIRDWLPLHMPLP